ncbi:MAG: hypothetical protein CM1200mP18_02900 [Gammaproteobacteria bacterium]|nr:MAG: hypothetical protein CM1200mP18_02900 [Gammaproteobacteria bacterium]
MATTHHSELVNVFYNTHPISESQVLDKLAQTGVDTSILTVELLNTTTRTILGPSCYRCTRPPCENQRINARAGLCCGLGGPARYLAYIMVAGLPGWI